MKRKGGRRLVKVAHVASAAKVLWDLMHEVEPHQAISHVKMPSWEEHLSFVQRYPYRAWYLIEAQGEFVGHISVSRKYEIGIRLFKVHQGKGHGKWAIGEIVRMWGKDAANAARPSVQRGALLANINPANEASIAVFTKLGFKHVQNTYALDVSPVPE